MDIHFSILSKPVHKVVPNKINNKPLCFDEWMNEEREEWEVDGAILEFGCILDQFWKLPLLQKLN